jgi:hypothetical protein
MPDFKDKATFVNAVCTRDTDKAILVEIDGDEFWIPQSHVDDDSEVYEEGQRGTLVISQWIAEQKGIV